jgi:hypothetical protein
MKKIDSPFYYIDKDYEEVSLSENQIFNDEWHAEVREMDKHEILVKICESLGTCPSNFTRAETLFDEIKFDIARYVIYHEYSQESSVRSKLLLWLEGKTNPDSLKKFNSFVQEYLK